MELIMLMIVQSGSVVNFSDRVKVTLLDIGCLLTFIRLILASQ